MSRPLRFVPEESRNWTDSYGQEIAVVEITIRTLLGMFFLTPTPQNRSLMVGVMAHVPNRVPDASQVGMFLLKSPGYKIAHSQLG